MHLLMFMCAIIVLLVVYFVPTMVARSRGHINATAIFVANLLLGWTIIGWAIAMTWAFTNTPASTTPLSALPQERKIVGFLKILLTGFAALCVFIVILNIFMSLSGKHLPSAAQGNYTKTPEATQPGVPTPADEILGK